MPEVKLSFVCPAQNCDGIVEEWLEISDPDYSTEVHSDGDAISDEHMSCPECSTDFVICVVNSMGHVSAELQDYDGVHIEAEVIDSPDQDYSDYLRDYDPPSNALDLYVDGVIELRDLLEKNPKEPEAGILYRMIFTQLIAIFEAFLADRLLRLVLDHEEIRNRLLDKSGMFKEMTLTLAEAVRDPDAGKKKMKSRLQSQLYHKLDEVKKLYQIALQVDIFPDEEVTATIATAITKRHDCVHRNGRDKEDNLNHFPVKYILDVYKALDSVVRHAEEGAKKGVLNLQSARAIAGRQ